VNKPVYFNIERDKTLLDFANSISNFSNWVKEKIREELTNKEVEIQVNQKLAAINDQPDRAKKKEPLKWNI
jgi:NADH dehydrogenase FAD-containing subunit